jgi:hypothetical protein
MLKEKQPHKKMNITATNTNNNTVNALHAMHNTNDVHNPHHVRTIHGSHNTHAARTTQITHATLNNHTSSHHEWTREKKEALMILIVTTIAIGIIVSTLSVGSLAMEALIMHTCTNDTVGYWNIGCLVFILVFTPATCHRVIQLAKTASADDVRNIRSRHWNTAFIPGFIALVAVCMLSLTPLLTWGELVKESCWKAYSLFLVYRWILVILAAFVLIVLLGSAIILGMISFAENFMERKFCNVQATGEDQINTTL